MKNPPKVLGSAGRSLWRRIGGWADEQGIVFEPHEVVVLTEACGVADRLAQLAEALVDWTPSDPASVRLLTEERLQRGALASLLITKMGIPTGLVDGAGVTPKQRRAQAAAAARWRDAKGRSA